MKITPILVPSNPFNNPSFGIRVGKTKATCYLPYCYITEDICKFKNYNITITKNYINKKLQSTLYYVTDMAGNWIKSKLKYIDENGNKSILRSKNNV